MADGRCKIYVVAHLVDGQLAGPCKVGISASPKARLAELQTGNPRPLILAGVFDSPSRVVARGIEGAFHAALDAWRLQGEWFNLHPDEAIYGVGKNLEHLINITFPDDAGIRATEMEITGVGAAMEIIANRAPHLIGSSGPSSPAGVTLQ